MANSTTNFASLLEGGMIQLYIGPKRKHFEVHRNILRSSCEHFNRILNSDMEYYWGAYQADAFELFINWLYRGTLSDILPGKSNDVSEGRNRIIHLYLLADDCGISSLKNLARDRIRAYHLRPSQGFTANDIEKFYFLTKPGSPLRVYIAESYLAALTTWSDASRKLKIEEFLNIEAKGFMVDAWDSVCKAHRKSPFKNSDKEKKCAFHEHAVGEKCKR